LNSRSKAKPRWATRWRGYIARAAYIMDRFMHALVLYGKSFLHLLIGFGCNMPAIMATRTLENRQDRLITILIITSFN